MGSRVQRPTVGSIAITRRGPEGLVDRSRRPHACSHATLEPIENTILVLRAKHPSWARESSRRGWRCYSQTWPAASTFGNISSRTGLTSPQKKRSESVMVHGFQRLFRNWRRQTMRPVHTDAHSGYLIRGQIVSRMDLSQVRAICEAAVREYGVPARIRTDNGTPFADRATGAVEAVTRVDEARDRA